MSRRRIFGFAVSPLSAEEIRDTVIGEAPPGGGVGLVVTPNIQHVALLGRDPAFRAAYDGAAVIVCDGFPVHYYARLRGVPTAGRVTGCAITDAVMALSGFPESHRLFFVVDSQATVDAVLDWAGQRGLSGRIATAVPPFGFEHDAGQSETLAKAIRDHGTTLLFMAVGAPKSEIFVHLHRALLPSCWALCIGRAVKTALGLVRRPPKVFTRFNLEWLWWLTQEPVRIAARCSVSVPGFLAAVALDMARTE